MISELRAHTNQQSIASNKASSPRLGSGRSPRTLPAIPTSHQGYGIAPSTLAGQSTAHPVPSHISSNVTHPLSQSAPHHQPDSYPALYQAGFVSASQNPSMPMTQNNSCPTNVALPASDASVIPAQPSTSRDGLSWSGKREWEWNPT